MKNRTLRTCLWLRSITQENSKIQRTGKADPARKSLRSAAIKWSYFQRVKGRFDMAMDFTTVLTSDAYRDLLTALVSLDAHLHRLHAQRGESLYREDVEGADADFRDGQQI